MSSVAAIIKERRSIKQFKSDPLPAGLLEELLEVAVWAPNHRMREPWRFIAFQGDGTRFLAEAVLPFLEKTIPDPLIVSKRKEALENIPLTLLVVMPEDEKQWERDEDLAAVAALVQNLQLAAWEKGVGTSWKTPRYIAEPEFLDKVGVKANEKIIAMLYLGYPQNVPTARPRKNPSQLLQVIDSFPAEGTVE